MLPFAWKATFWFAVCIAGNCSGFQGDRAPVKLGFKLWKEEFDETEVVSNVGRSQVWMGGRGAQQVQAPEH